jgi:hypothetical protein
MEQSLPIEPAEPRHPETAPVLITSRRRAAVALCFAGYFAARGYWSLLVSHRVDVSGWLFPFNSIWPNWVEAILNLWIYGFMIWLLVAVCTRLRKEERVFCAVWITEILVSPLKSLAPMPFATAVLWSQWFGDLLMLVAAVIIYRNIAHSDNVGPESDPTETQPTPKSTS